MNIDESKSYKTEDNLHEAIKKCGFGEDRYVVVCNRKGRFTAIFPASNLNGGDMTVYARRGFMTLG